MTASKTEFKLCCACESSALEEIIDLPKLPHIGIYLDKSASQAGYEPIDNALYRCTECSHIQLKYAVDPAFLYRPSFQHKTSQSASAMQANLFLRDFILDTMRGKSIRKIAEIGCNDTFLLSLFSKQDNIKLVGVDPILNGKEAEFLSGLDENEIHKFSVVGDFIENAVFGDDPSEKPNVLVSNFVFEHLANPRSVVSSMLEAISDDGVCFIGVPTAEYMVYNARFDQISHQHYQQFSERTLCNMVQSVGGSICQIARNFTNWGQIVVAFSKNKNTNFFNVGSIREGIDVKLIKDSFSCFKCDIQAYRSKISLLLNSGVTEIFGYGAAQNFPIFAYFNDFDLAFKKIIDDHPLRQNCVFPGVPDIETTGADRLDYRGSTAVLTGPDYARVLFKRIGELKFDHIVSPFTSY